VILSLPSESELPLQLGHYTLVAKLGEGGMASVYRCLRDDSNEAFAIKLLKRNGGALADAIEFIDRFRREADFGTRLEHQHLCKPIESGRFDGHLHYIVFEELEGQTLAARRHEIRDKSTACCIARVVAEAAAYLHKNHIIHRDIKPSNIMFRHANEDLTNPIVTDYGLAVDLSSTERYTFTGRFYGTANYASPEQLLDSKHVDGTTDIYAIGVVLFWMLTGNLPFERLEPGDPITDGYVQRRLSIPAATLRDFGVFPEIMISICRNCLQADRARRYGSAMELSDELAEAIEHCN
jgi:serine/threonine protein kinase